MASKPNIQVFISTYNRPDLVVKSINSVLQQSYRNIEVIVSDNSTNNATQEIIQRDFSEKVNYVRRIPSVDGITHLNMILKEVSVDFFIIFHDDDIMYPDMVETLYNKIHNDASIAAVAANARIVRHSKPTSKTFFSDRTPSISINTPDEMAYQYLCGKIAPFPSYMYRKKVAEVNIMDSKQGGKYCDVSFLIKTAKLGKIEWCETPLMDYYYHQGQDSYNNDFRARLRLIYFINLTTSFKRKSKELYNYRLMNVYNEWVSMLKKDQAFPLKKKTLLLLFKHSPFNFFPKMIFHRILKRAKDYDAK